MFKRKLSLSQGSSSSQPMKFQRKRRVGRPKTPALLTEVKYNDTYISNSNVTQTASVYSLNAVAQGDNYNQRNGNQVLNRYLQFNWSIKQYAGTPASYQYTVYIVLDRQCNGSQPVASDILDTTVLPVQFAMKALFKNQERFRVLRTYKSLVGEAYNDLGVVNDFIDLTKMESKDRVVRYQSGAGIDPQTNGLFMLVVSENNTANNVAFYAGVRWAFNES